MRSAIRLDFSNQSRGNPVYGFIPQRRGITRTDGFGSYGLATVFPSVFQCVVILTKRLERVQSLTLPLPVGVADMIHGEDSPAIRRRLHASPVTLQDEGADFSPLGAPHIRIIVFPTPLPALANGLQFARPTQPLPSIQRGSTQHLRGGGEWAVTPPLLDNRRSVRKQTDCYVSTFLDIILSREYFRARQSIFGALASQRPYVDTHRPTRSAA